MTEDETYKMCDEMAAKVIQLVREYTLIGTPAVPIAVICKEFIVELSTSVFSGCPTQAFERTIADAISILKQDRAEWLNNSPTKLKEDLNRVASDLHL